MRVALSLFNTAHTATHGGLVCRDALRIFTTVLSVYVNRTRVIDTFLSRADAFVLRCCTRELDDIALPLGIISLVVVGVACTFKP